MTSYTIKALLMIAMFGAFEAALNFPTMRRLHGSLARLGLARLGAELLHWLAPMPHTLQPAKVKVKQRKG